MAAKRQNMTRIQLEIMDSEELVKSFLLLQDEILGNQEELLQQNNTINERLEDLSKKFQDLLKENNVIKSRLAVAENTSSILKSNKRKLNKQLINVSSVNSVKKRFHYKFEQYSRRECIDIQGIPEDIKIINLEDTVIKIFEKNRISIKKRMIVTCHRLGKTTKIVAKFANRKDAELALKINKAKRYQLALSL